MKKNILKLLSIVIVSSMLLTFAGCGVKKSEKTEPESGKQSVDGKKEPVKLTFINYFVRDNLDGNGKAFVAAMEKYKADNPNITIEEEILSHDAYETKIKTLAAANELPDLFLLKGSMLSTFIENKLINPLNDLLDKDPEWKNSFKEGVFDDFTIDDKIYGIPFQMMSTHAIYYNKKIFEEAGFTAFPKDWDEFKDAVTKIKAKGYVPIALGNKGKWVAESCILSALGDRFTGTDWFLSIKEKQGAKFTDPEFVNALSALQELAKMGAFNTDMNSIDNEQQRTLYYNGKAAMFFEGGWAVSQVVADAPKEVIDATELTILPAVKGGKGDSKAISGGAGWAYNMNSKLNGVKKEAAEALLRALMNKDVAKIAVENNAMPAVNPDSYDKSKLSPLAVKYVELISNTKVVPVYDVQLTPPVIEVMNSGLQELLINVVSPEDLAKKIQTEYEKQ
ncbi:MAG: ABC-type sugar transport system, periplasmic component [Clostridia bacterium]|jgi:raffinose/stachyose/melibiose transport system substrate-binding protein|nr:ABC-type sugar transport system, periplasmic component [Clostridia bacterium]